MKSYAGHKVARDVYENYETLLEVVNTHELSAEFIIRASVKWHGAEVYSAEFMEHLLKTELNLEEDGR